MKVNKINIHDYYCRFIPILLMLFLANVAQAQQTRSEYLKYLTDLLNENTDQSKSILQQEVLKLEKSDAEKDLILAESLYDELGEEQRRDALSKRILKQFPKGIKARGMAYETFTAAIPNLQIAQIEKLYLDWLKTYPPTDFDPDSKGIYDMALMKIIPLFAKDNLRDKVYHYSNAFYEKSYKTVTYCYVAEAFAANQHDAEAIRFYEEALRWSQEAKNSADAKQRSSFGAMFYDKIVAELAQLKLKSGEPNFAITEIRPLLNASQFVGMQALPMTQTLADAYLVNGEKLNAFLTIQAYLKNNSFDDQLLSKAREIYLALNGDHADFQPYIAELSATKRRDNMNNLKKSMINEDIPDFSLFDTAGKEVHFKDLRGKIVVMDFWATWCIPCLKSFPGMQEVINKYKDAKDIVFLFVNTKETGNSYKDKVAKIMHDNQYTFHVLYDEVTSSNKTLLSNRLGISSIPTKLVIDKSGKLRFRITASDTDKDAIVEELSLLLDTVRQQ